MRLPFRKKQSARSPAPFVVGVGRSGTTLLRLMLDAHPDLAMPPETGFIPDLIAAARPDDATPERLLAAVTSHRKWGDFPMEPEELLARWQGLERVRPRGAVRAFYELYAEKQGKPRWGDKTPGYTMEMRQISRVLPEARFVHVIRDGRAVALSRMRTLALRPTEIDKVANRWRKRLLKARRQGGKLDHYLEIRYETLVREPEPTLRRVAEFIDLPWDPAHAELPRALLAAALRSSTATFPPGARSSPGPPRAGWRSTSRRRSRSTPRGSTAGATSSRADEIDVFEREAGELLDELGYERVTGVGSPRA